MFNVLQRTPVELCSVLLLLAGLVQASPVDIEVNSYRMHSLRGHMADLIAFTLSLVATNKALCWQEEPHLV